MMWGVWINVGLYSNTLALISVNVYILMGAMPQLVSLIVDVLINAYSTMKFFAL